MEAKSLQAELDRIGDPARGTLLQRFFKTGPGDYAEGDIFLGLTVPTVRKVVGKYKGLPLPEIEKLLESPIHEHRFSGLIIMVMQAKKADQATLKSLYDLYLRRTDRINNWDLVDVSCPNIVGAYLIDKPRDILYKLAKSKSLWERRIAIISTAWFIRERQLQDTFKISELLIDDTHDLINKAVGWMLREAGKKDEQALKLFLDKHAATMPRTALRYSLEKLHPDDRVYYMNIKHSGVK